jgi:Protein of unknown function (DUF1566)
LNLRSRTMSSKLSRTLKFSLVGAGALLVLLQTSDTHANAPAGRYTISNGTVYDTKTKLTWQQTAPSTTYKWGSASASGTAQNYCALLSLNAVTGWRVPTIGELMSLVDYTNPGSSMGTGTTAMIDSTYFPSAPYGTFWTATSYSEDPADSAWTVSFNSGTTGSQGQQNGYSVRCVH